MRARQPIEQRRFADVRIAGERDSEIGVWEMLCD
jgi:hypothetical protein